MLGWRGPSRLAPTVQIHEHWCCLLPIVLGNASCPYCHPLLRFPSHFPLTLLSGLLCVYTASRDIP